MITTLVLFSRFDNVHPIYHEVPSSVQTYKNLFAYFQFLNVGFSNFRLIYGWQCTWPCSTGFGSCQTCNLALFLLSRYLLNVELCALQLTSLNVELCALQLTSFWWWEWITMCSWIVDSLCVSLFQSNLWLHIVIGLSVLFGLVHHFQVWQ
jgi:hypothetical protein